MHHNSGGPTCICGQPVQGSTSWAGKWFCSDACKTALQRQVCDWLTSLDVAEKLVAGVRAALLARGGGTQKKYARTGTGRIVKENSDFQRALRWIAEQQVPLAAGRLSSDWRERAMAELGIRKAIWTMAVREARNRAGVGCAWGNG